MKKLWLLAVLVFAFGCDDGDFPLEEIDFTSTSSVAACDATAGVTLLFKIDGAVALILEIPNTFIVNTLTEEGVPREVDLSTNAAATVFYRGFNTTITSSYFCDELPPSDVQVNLEYTANDGIVKVVTTAASFDPDDPTIITSYKHDITFENIVFTDTEGNSLIEEFLDYGSITINAE